MKYLVLENDYTLFDRFEEYLSDKDATVIFGVDSRDSEEIVSAFETHHVLAFSPTLITFSQYNLLAMIMYDCLQREKLCIDEIHIFAHRETIEEELKKLWEGKRKYLDKVLEKVKLFVIDTYDFEKTEIFI